MERVAGPVLVGLAGLAIVTLTSCTGAKDTSTQDAWTSRAESFLRDPNGLGSGAGGAPGIMDLGIAGKPRWTIYATCANADALQAIVKSGDAVVARTTLTCGTNTPIPVEVNPAAHLSLEIKRPDLITGLPYWFAAVNTPTWTPKTPKTPSPTAAS